MLDPELVLPNAIRRRAAEQPNQILVDEVGGRQLTYGDFDALADRWAGAFKQLGVGRGDTVATMLPPRIEALTAWIGLGRIGAIDACINTDHQGRILKDAVGLTSPKVLVVAAPYLDRFNEIWASLPSVEAIVVAYASDALPTLRVRAFTVDQMLGSVQHNSGMPTMPWDIACIVLTSGTTGPSKGVLVPWAQMYAAATRVIPMDDLESNDAFYSPLPTFHAAARYFFHLMVLTGGRFVCRDRFDLAAYWQDVRTHTCTVGVLPPLVATAPVLPDDANNPMRIGFTSQPRPELERRFGLRVCTAFGMTEIGACITSGWELIPGSCGRILDGYPGFEARIVDEHDEEVPVGTTGELVVRTREPWTLCAGYFGLPEKTAEAWRNGWFHTGDAFQQDEAGNYYFVDRFKDALRRGGENISSFEVEVEVLAHPHVAECAAVAAPGDAMGDEVKIVVVPRAGGNLDPRTLIEFLVPRIPRFMLPRYVEIMDELPRTPTMKVHKAELRTNALNDRTWDRIAAGFHVVRVTVPR